MRSEIIERLEKLTGPDREVDRAIMAVAYRWEKRHIGTTCWDDGHDTCCVGGKHIDNVWVDPAADKWVTTATDGFDFTASLDAAITLVERMLPGWAWTVHSDPLNASMWTPEGTSGDTTYQVPGGTPAIALLIALFRALEVSDAE